MSAHEVFVANQAFIERALRHVCARQHLSAPDAEDFCSAFRLRLLENDCEVIRKFEGRSALQTYLVSVVTHFYQDWRNARWGKWRPSAEARRIGPLAVELETLWVRDQIGFDTACEQICARHPGAVTHADLHAIAVRLPHRQLRSFVDDSEVVDMPAADSPDTLLLAREAGEMARRLTAGLRDALGELHVQDRLIVRMLVEDGLPVTVIARTLNLKPKPMYRRIQLMFETLRTRLESLGFPAAAVTDLLRHPGFDESGPDGAEIAGEVRLFSRKDRAATTKS